MNSLIEQVKSLPGLLRETFQEIDDTARQVLHPELILSLKRIYITGCGDSHHAGLTTQLAFDTITGLPTTISTALEFARYKAGFLPQSGPNTNLVVGISVSGSVARTYEALKMADEAGATTLSLTATPESRVGEAGKLLFAVPAPAFSLPEDEVSPGARSFFINQVALLLMAIRIGEVRGTITTAQATAYRNEILDMAEIIELTIQKNDALVKSAVEDLQQASEFVFVGGGPNYGIALFSAAKVLEASGDPALGQDTEEWAHLQYFAREPLTPTCFITAADRDFSRMDEVIVAAKQIGRQVVVVCPENSQKMIENADYAFTFPPVPEMFSALVTQVPGELFAAYRTEVIGESFFRNFEGGRSVEGGGGISRIRTSETWETWQQ